MPIGIFPKSFSTKRVNVASGPPNNRVSPDLPLTENDELGKTGKIQDDAGNETSQNDPMTNNDLRAVSPMPEPLKNPYNPFKRSPTSSARSRDKDMNNTAKDRGMPTEKLALNVSLNPFKRNSSLNTRETNVDSNVKRDNETSAPAKNDKTTASSVNPVNEKESVTPGTKKPMTNNPPLSQLNTVSQPLSVKSSIIQVTSAAGNGKPQSYADKNNPKSLAVNGTSPRKSIDNTPPAELDDIQVQTRLHGRRATIVDNEALLKSEQLTFRRALENFVGNTSISGLPQILTSRYKFTRTLWTIALLACLAVFLVNAIVLITRYYEFPVETKVTVTFSISSEFPSVTLCNLNPVRLSQIRKNARFSTALQKTMPELAAEVQKSVEKVKQTLGEELYQQLENKAQKYSLPGYTAQPGYCDDIYVLFAAIDNTSSPQECAKICDNIPKLCKGFVMTQNSLCKPIHAVCKGKILYSENNEHTLYIRDRRRRRSIDLTEATQILRDKRDTLTNQTTPSYTDYTLRRKYSQEYAKLPPRDRVALAHQEEDFIVGCSWNGEDCDMSTIYQFQTYRLGNCFTFNHGRQNTTVRKISKSGPDYGLTLTLNIEQYEYVPSITDTAGIRVVIHSKDVMPYPANDGITIAPGFASNVGIKRRVIIRKPDPYGNCTRPEDALYKPKSYGYSVKACLMDCLQRSVKEHCGCRYPSLLSDEEVTRMCDDMPGAHDELCFQRIHKKYIDDTLGCYCPEACEDVSYQMEVSTAKWPAVNNREKWEKKVANKNPELKKLIESGTEFAKAENNFAQLKVFYQELNLEKTAQSPAYPRENLLGDLGGQLGLWVGLSMLTLCECIEFLWIVGVIGFQNCKSFVKQRRERGATGEVKKKANGKTDDY